jgi:hypothetical protein
MSFGYFCKLCLLKVCMESCSSPLLQWRGLSASYFYKFCLLKFHVAFSSLPLPPFSGELKAPHLLYCMSFSVPCLVFSFVFARWGQFVQGLCWFIPGVAVGVPRATYLLTGWSVSPKQVWSPHLAAWEPSCFLM